MSYIERQKGRIQDIVLLAYLLEATPEETRLILNTYREVAVSVDSGSAAARSSKFDESDDAQSQNAESERNVPAFTRRKKNPKVEEPYGIPPLRQRLHNLDYEDSQNQNREYIDPAENFYPYYR